MKRCKESGRSNDDQAKRARMGWARKEEKEEKRAGSERSLPVSWPRAATVTLQFAARRGTFWLLRQGLVACVHLAPWGLAQGTGGAYLGRQSRHDPR